MYLEVLVASVAIQTRESFKYVLQINIEHRHQTGGEIQTRPEKEGGQADDCSGGQEGDAQHEAIEGETRVHIEQHQVQQVEATGCTEGEQCGREREGPNGRVHHQTDKRTGRMICIAVRVAQNLSGAIPKKARWLVVAIILSIDGQTVLWIAFWYLKHLCGNVQ